MPSTTSCARSGVTTDRPRASAAARTGLGVVVPAANPKPDIGTPEAFKRSMLAAKSIAYRDPSLPNMSGEMVERVFKKLGIFDEVKPRMIVAARPAAEDLAGTGKVVILPVDQDVGAYLIAVDKDTCSGRMLERPQRQSIPIAAQEQLVVELYSK